MTRPSAIAVDDLDLEFSRSNSSGEWKDNTISGSARVHQGHVFNLTLNNYREGSQFYHNGKGHQHLCSTGVQITGNRSTIHFHSSLTTATATELSATRNNGVAGPCYHIPFPQNKSFGGRDGVDMAEDIDLTTTRQTDSPGMPATSTGSKEIECPTCTKLISSKHMSRHKKHCVTGRCDGKPFFSIAKWNYHLVNCQMDHSGRGPTRTTQFILCHVCEKAFSRVNFKSHVNKEHPKQSPRSEEKVFRVKRQRS